MTHVCHFIDNCRYSNVFSVGTVTRLINSSYTGCFIPLEFLQIQITVCLLLQTLLNSNVSYVIVV